MLCRPQRARERKMGSGVMLFASLLWVVWVTILLHLHCTSSAASGDELREVKSDSHTIGIDSLLPPSPSSSSNPSLHSKAAKTRSSLPVVHKHGPCSQAPDPSDFLTRDQARVNFIHTKLSNGHRLSQRDSADLPAKDGSIVGSGNYVVTIGIGTPKKQLSLIFDTGSDLTWTQCQPCVRSCYSQKEPIFDPSLSSSYHNVSCSAPACAALSSATGRAGSCSSSTCLYGIQYGDSSFSVGYLAKEKITLTTSNVFDGIYFGCGENSDGLFGGSAGLLGLGRNQISFPSQTESAYKKIFSYCLPSSSNYTGHLTFGSAGLSRAVKFTPISNMPQDASFYGLDIVGISVGGQKLGVPLSVFSSAGAIIDSGTVITRLPPKAYAMLRSAFREKMSKYQRAPELSILDTCYDLSGLKTVTIPKIGLWFRGGVEVEVDAKGILYANKLSQVCLAFAGNGDDSSVAIIGNTQQQTIEVVYDGAGGRIGFAPGGCN